MCSEDLRWRIVYLIHIHDVDRCFASELFGTNHCTVRRYHTRFLRTGSARDIPPVLRASRWPAHVVQNLKACMKSHPTFCIDEFQDHLRVQCPNLRNTSEESICRALNFDMRLIRKKLMTAAREAAPAEIQNYYNKLQSI